jgi:tetratricopeptide (TPR) repeat protein
LQRGILGPEHQDTLRTMVNLGNVLVQEGRYPEGEKLFRETLNLQTHALGLEHPDTALSMYNLGCIAAHRGRSDEALSWLRQAVDHGLAPFADLGMGQDPDLKSLHGDTRFAALVAHAKERAAVAQKPH